MKRSLKPWRPSLLACSLIPVLAGCGGHSGSSVTGRAQLTVKWPERSRLIPNASNSIRATVKLGAQVIGTQLLARPASGGQTTATFDNLKVGSMTLTATAFPNADGSGTAQATGSAPLTIANGQTTQVTVTMDSTIDHVELSATTLNVPLSGTAALTATAKDTAGAVVLTSASKTQWSSDNPAVASVDSQGVVTGVAAGSTVIHYKETESGKTAACTVTVKSSGPISFLPYAQLATPPLNDSILAGDLDKDGKADIVTSSGQEIGALYGRGDGTFDPYVRVILWGNSAMARGIADMDGDGRLDIVFKSGDGNVVVLKNLGGRSFGSPVSSFAGGKPDSDFTIADINNDGKPDLALAVSDESTAIGSARMFLNQGNGALVLQKSVNHIGYVQGVAVGDINGDGKVDIASSYETSTVNDSGVEIYFGDGAGNYTSHQDIKVGTGNMYSPRFVDFNKDGKLDLALGNYWSAQLATWFNDGTGTFGGFSGYIAGPYTLDVKPTDFNGDGYVDLAVASTGSSVKIFQNIGGTRFDAGTTFEIGPGNCRQIAIADFNNDGKPDICAECEPQPFAYVLINNSP